MSERPQTPLLDQVEFPADIRKLQKSQLPQLADELRSEMISAVSTSGGHLGSGLGVVELTVAIHYVFDTPIDMPGDRADKPVARHGSFEAHLIVPWLAIELTRDLVTL